MPMRMSLVSRIVDVCIVCVGSVQLQSELSAFGTGSSGVNEYMCTYSIM